jgi:hypothetical protein
MASTYLDMYRGDDESFDVAVVDKNGVVVNLTGASLRFTVKRDAADLDVDAVITKTTGSGITVTNAAGGIARIDIAATDTSAMIRGTLLVWDLQVRDSNSKTRTLASGTLRIIVDVSRTTP